MSEKCSAFDQIRMDPESIVNRRPSGPTLTNSSMISCETEVEEQEAKNFEKFEDPFKKELKQKLAKQRRSIDSYEEPSFIPPTVLHLESPKVEKPTHRFDGRPSAQQVNMMEELKKKLNKNQISSNYDVDRIVKETKTTTITQSKETIHFKKTDEAKTLNTSTPNDNSKAVTKVDSSTMSPHRNFMKSDERKNSLNPTFPSHIEQWESPRPNTFCRRE